MRITPRTLFAALFLFAAPALAQAGDTGHSGHGGGDGGGHGGAIEVKGAWVRAALPGRPTAGYLMLMNGTDKADRLVAVESPEFATIEIHESRLVDGVMHMDPVANIEIGAGAMAELKPGGMHLMLFGGKAIKDGNNVTLTLVFESGHKLDVTAPVKKRGGGHSGHGGKSGHSGHGSD